MSIKFCDEWKHWEIILPNLAKNKKVFICMTFVKGMFGFTNHDYDLSILQIEINYRKCMNFHKNSKLIIIT